MSTFTLANRVADIDSKIANRRTGLKEKGPPAYVVLEEALGIRTVGGLLRHYPRRYIDRTATTPIRDIRLGQFVTVIAKVKSVQVTRTKRTRQSMVIVQLYDGTGYLRLTFFNQPWTGRVYREGMEVAASGLVAGYQRRLGLKNQEVEILRGGDAEMVHMGRITPVHPAAEGISTRTIRELIHRALQRIDAIPDPFPSQVVADEALGSEDEALRSIHFPEEPEALNRARDRLKFDELFTLELGVAYRKRRIERGARGVAHQVDGELTAALSESLPFELTGAQRRAMKEIEEDMGAPRPMNRLLQGDVGSGKTVVALHAALIAIQSGHQATIMAPTEVLAAQHLRTVEAILGAMGGSEYLSSLVSAELRGQQSLLDQPEAPSEEPIADAPVKFALLTAAVTGRDRQLILEGVRSGEVDLIVGTHALVQEGVAFADLSLAVIDEQHRFGVHQRVALKEKGTHPDVLIMTATPIPRTLSLTYYGDLDVSVLDEMPPGRQPVITRVARSAAERRAAYDLLRDEVRDGRQAFVVCAAIDEGNRLEVRAAEKEADRLAKDVFPDLRIGLLHGRLRPADKEAIMSSFRAGDADVLISTTVIEVGVDVPNASVMLVENAERFGLAQLHQLRGRIGRGAARSFCILFDESGPENADAKARLQAMARTTDGFELADEDLRLRGEGTLFDIRQSGLPDLRLARLSEDAELVRRARTRAFEVIDGDPTLKQHPTLLELLRATFRGDAIDWLFHS